MSNYSSFNASAANVLERTRGFLDHEREVLPHQFAQAEAWSTQAVRKLEDEIEALRAKVQSRGRDYLARHPEVAQHLQELEEKLNSIERQGRDRFDHFLHDGTHSGLPPTEIHPLAHGTDRKAGIYGSEALNQAGNAHAQLAEEIARGSAGRW